MNFLFYFIFVALTSQVLLAESFSEIFGNNLINSEKQFVSINHLNRKIIGIYFSAHWCSPCRKFTPQLIDFYNMLKKENKPFEIIFISSDKTEDDMFEYINETEMPWLTLFYEDSRKNYVKSKYNARGGIPKLVILDNNAEMITENGREYVSGGSLSYKKWFSELDKTIEQEKKEKVKKKKSKPKLTQNKKSNKNVYKCLEVKNGAFLLINKNRSKTNVYKLYGVEFPFKKWMQKQFALNCFTSSKNFKKFLPTINRQLNSYEGAELIVKKKFDKYLWLETSDGRVVNLEVIKEGIALPKTSRIKREYLSLLKNAKHTAIKNENGIWNLPPRYNPADDLKIKKNSNNIKTKIKERRSRHSSFYTVRKTWENSREIKLEFDTVKLKRKIEVIIKYQFKKKVYSNDNYDYGRPDKSKLSFSKIFTKKVVLFPPEKKVVTLKSSKITLTKYFDSDGAKYGHTSGQDYAGDAIEVYCDKELIFKQGDLKK